MLKPGKYLSGKNCLYTFVVENQKTKNYETSPIQNRMCMHGYNQRKNVNMQRAKRGKKRNLHSREKRRKLQSRRSREKNRSNQRHLPDEIHKRRADIPKTDIFKMERRTGKSKSKSINNNHTIMKEKETKKIIEILIKILKWLYTSTSKK